MYTWAPLDAASNRRASGPLPSNELLSKEPSPVITMSAVEIFSGKPERARAR
eukprot:CAMPEP_0177674638 /NCGR_PEP_ID=MMETSP0447-20121125/26691_1 /TAXON_ID=0 /ORGANISM="Stygamoeba regulata, Strain BSH-02190019" /LENGTH=51 /DNA_ID=CAMNT_0019182805 /DNA_START=149 /DNA_END=301 /DNA_ORIENTATION=-